MNKKTNIILMYRSGNGESHITRILDFKMKQVPTDEDFITVMEEEYHNYVFANDHRDTERTGAIVLAEGQPAQDYDRESDAWTEKKQELKEL